MGALKEAATARATTSLKAKATSRSPEETELKMHHPTMDSPEAAGRVTYNPAPPQKRFMFLKRFSQVPGLRAKGAAAAQQNM